MNKLLFDKNGTITFNRDLATEIGVNEAIMLQQIHYWIEHNKTEFLRGSNKHAESYQAGKFWTKNKVESWKDEHFPFLSISTIRRTLKSLEDNNYIIVDSFNNRKFDNTLWYTINYEKLDELEKIIENNLAKREVEKIAKQQEKKRKALEFDLLRQEILMAETLGTAELSNLNNRIAQSNTPSVQNEQSQCSERIDEVVNLNNTSTKITTKTTTKITPKEFCTTLSDELTMSSEGDGEEVIKLVEKETHILLTTNMKRKVRKWNIKRVALAIKIFIEKKGERFALLEKIYSDDRNFIPNYSKNSNSSEKKVGNFNNFQQRDYDYDALEKKLLGWEE